MILSQSLPHGMIIYSIMGQAASLLSMLIADGLEDFASKVLSIFRDKDIRDILSTRGRKLAEKFTWQRGTEKLGKVLAELIKR